jgi:hypothetical protein
LGLGPRLIKKNLLDRVSLAVAPTDYAAHRTRIATGLPILLAMPTDLSMVQMWLHRRLLHIQQIMKATPQTLHVQCLPEKLPLLTRVAGDLFKTRITISILIVLIA